MKNHMMEQHEGKHTLSPERKATKQFQEEVVNTKINLDGETITIPQQEQEHLHDMLVQTGKDKKNILKKVAEVNRRLQNYEKKTQNWSKRTNSLKLKMKKANGYINKLNKEHQKQLLDANKQCEEQNVVIKILKDQLKRQGAVAPLSGAGGISSPRPPQNAKQEAPTANRSTAAPLAGSPATSQTDQVPQDTSQPATEVTPATSQQEVTREDTVHITGTTGHQPDQVDECVENIQCPGNCEHIGCKIIQCEECSFKTDSESRLESHLRVTHRIICFTCKDAFKTFSEMIEHRSVTHPSTKKCSNFPNCERGDLCLYKHKGSKNDATQENHVQGINDPIACRICLSEFHDKNEMMIHRKSDHLNIVGICKNIEAGLTCRKGPDHCWYRHDMMTNSRPTSRNHTTGPAFNAENFPFRPTPQGAVVGQSQMQLQMIQHSLQT